ncbi:hypothetical protein NESM_000263800 [Novymonas esmeraldas]|uniref:Uncharacterized protein n=1 Tax=Novymonas esmeraldas TaxID=1808958 RepID=A0AAW0FCA1_9TRYP
MSQLSASEGGAAAPLVRFSLLYQLRHRACSVTARNSVSPPRGAFSRLHSRTSPSSRDVTAGLEYSTPTRSGSQPTAMVPPAHLSPPASSVAASPHPTDLPLLSTMDRRELSKVVVRDAVFARLLDLVPSRQHVQTAVWTLSPHVIQIDGAVAVCVAPRDAAVGHDLPSAAIRLGGSSAGALGDVDGVREAVRERVAELVLDARLFACLLQPYLGDVGCDGDIVDARVDLG